MARKRYWLGSTGPFFYDPTKQRLDGSNHAVQFEEAPIIGSSLAATQEEVATNAGVQKINNMEEDYVTIAAQTPLTVTSVSGLVTVSISGYTGTVTLPSVNDGYEMDLVFSNGVLQTVTEREVVV